MRKWLCCAVLILLACTLAACDTTTNNDNQRVKLYEMTTIITTAGYNMIEQPYGMRFDYQRQEIYNKYDLNPDLCALYKGFDKEGLEIVLVGFCETDDAIAYVGVLEADATEDRLIYREAQVVILTYSERVVGLYD